MMGDVGKPCEERRKLTAQQIFWRVAPMAVTVILFVILYFVKIPATAAQEKIERHETRITTLETEAERWKRVEKKVDDIYTYLLGGRP